MGMHAQSCLTLCDPMDGSPPGSSVHGIFQTRILEWVAIPFSRESSQFRDQTQVSSIDRRILYHCTTCCCCCCCCWVASVMFDSVRPHRRQPTRLPHPWDSPARTLERVAISFSNAWKWKVKVKLLSRVQLFTTPWTAAHQAPPSMGFSRQEYWSGVPLPSPTVPPREPLKPWEKRTDIYLPRLNL